MLFVTGPHVGVLEDIAATVARLLAPGCLVGATAVSVLGGREEVEGTPGVTLWAGTTGAVSAHHVEVLDGPDGPRLVGVDGADLEAAGTALLLADPASFPVDAVLDALAAGHPDLTVAGGLASAGFRPGANRLVLDGALHDRGRRPGPARP